MKEQSARPPVSMASGRTKPTHAVWTRRGRTLAILAYAGRVWAAAAAWGDFAPFFTKSKPAALRKEIGGQVVSCPSRGSRHSRWAQAVEIRTPAAHAGEERGRQSGQRATSITSDAPC